MLYLYGEVGYVIHVPFYDNFDFYPLNGTLDH